VWKPTQFFIDPARSPTKPPMPLRTTFDQQRGASPQTTHRFFRQEDVLFRAWTSWWDSPVTIPACSLGKVPSGKKGNFLSQHNPTSQNPERLPFLLRAMKFCHGRVLGRKGCVSAHHPLLSARGVSKRGLLFSVSCTVSEPFLFHPLVLCL